METDLEGGGRRRREERKLTWCPNVGVASIWQFGVHLVIVRDRDGCLRYGNVYGLLCSVLLRHNHCLQVPLLVQ